MVLATEPNGNNLFAIDTEFATNSMENEQSEDNTLTMEKLRSLEKAGWLKLGESHHKYPPAAEKDGE
jgi:hypothetical protein